MARIRSVKPEFWTAEQVMECSPMARLLFIGMWNFCDDGGNHPASAKTLKAEVFPADDITSSSIQELVNELVSNGLIFEYEAAGKRYWHVTGWHHQKIEKPNFKHPKPVNQQPIDDQSESGRQPIDDLSTPEWSGEERKGVNNLSVVAGSGAPEASDENSAAQPAPTRKGIVCGLLRKAGMADAAPHYLTDETWDSILSKRTNEEIVAVAQAKMAARPNQRTGLKYIAPALLQDPDPIAANARASPAKSSIHAEREAVSFGLTGRKPKPNELPNAASERDITAESIRIA